MQSAGQFTVYDDDDRGITECDYYSHRYSTRQIRSVRDPRHAVTCQRYVTLRRSIDSEPASAGNRFRACAVACASWNSGKLTVSHPDEAHVPQVRGCRANDRDISNRVNYVTPVVHVAAQMNQEMQVSNSLADACYCEGDIDTFILLC
jgi:hypothetical protein